MRAGRPASIERLLGSLLQRAAGRSRRAATRTRALGAGLPAVRGIDFGLVKFDERVGGRRVPRIGVLLVAFRGRRAAKQDDLVGRHARHPDVLFGDVADRLDALLRCPLRRVVWNDRPATEVGKALAEALHLRLDALDIRLELVRDLRPDRPCLVAQRGQPITHLIEHVRLGRLVRSLGRGARAIEFVVGLVRHLNPLALVDGPTRALARSAAVAESGRAKRESAHPQGSRVAVNAGLSSG